MKLYLPDDKKIYGYAQFGSMWKKGEVPKCQFRMMGEDGEEIPLQSRITAYWPDGSIKWAAHTADSRLMGKCVEVLPGEGKIFENKAECRQDENGWTFLSDKISVQILSRGRDLFRNLTIAGNIRIKAAYLRLMIERRACASTVQTQTIYQGESMITEAVMEDCGPLMWSFCLKGAHWLDEPGEKKFPFTVRLKLYRDTARMDIQHTFLFDGDEQKDFLKGIGIILDCPMAGDTFDRHIRFGTDYGTFHESASQMLVWDHKHPGKIYEEQMKGNPLGTGVLNAEETKRLRKIAEDCPVWDHFQLFQDSDIHFCIRKQTFEKNCCFLNALHGIRAKGTMAFGGTNGSIMVGLKNFWQKYPSGLEISGFSSDMAEAVIWIYTPAAEAYDYRHYSQRAYAETCYEGFPDFGATPFGVANTNECSLEFREELIPTEDILSDFGNSVADPPVYFGKPEYYHALHAFGFWSLPARRTEAECWLEEQLDKAVDFYKKEVEERHWYGIYDYGDVCHTYDAFRHVWRYDIGGYAWQNTELMPTMWLWLAFLRTGRSDILKLAEAMSRHASDIDTYHLGELKGLGTRHGVRHWGCPCKEIRIGMAGHYRYHYYLLCDRRMEDVFEDVRDADFGLINMDPLRYVYDKESQKLPTHARSGPDWSAMVSNWMTQWERTLDECYLQKILTGMKDIKTAPLGLISGPDFEYDPLTGHLGYIGECATGGTHLQIALGGPQVWMEMADLLEDNVWCRMIARYGRFYYLTDQEKQKESKGLVGKREFLYPVMAAAMAAYSAAFFQDVELARKTVLYIFRALIPGRDHSGFASERREDCGNMHDLQEIPWISTNFVSQWCLNVIMILEFVREYIPETMEEVDKMLDDFPEEGLVRNC